jgi:hypothetical protein
VDPGTPVGVEQEGARLGKEHDAVHLVLEPGEESRGQLRIPFPVVANDGIQIVLDRDGR